MLQEEKPLINPPKKDALIQSMRKEFEQKEEDETPNNSAELSPIYLEKSLIEEMKKAQNESGAQGVSDFVDALFNKLIDKELTPEQIEKIVRRIEILEFFESADRKKKYINYQSTEQTEEKFRKIIEDLFWVDETNNCVSFEEFKKRLEQVFVRFVLTAHPVYPFSEDLMLIQSQLITGKNLEGKTLTNKEKTKILNQLVELSFTPEKDLSTERELEISQKPIANIRQVFFRFRKIALEIAREHFPNEWEQINIQLMQLASWILYDTDGRTDINQFQSLQTASNSKLNQFEFIQSKLAEIDQKDENLDTEFENLTLVIENEINLLRQEQDLLETGLSDYFENQEKWLKEDSKLTSLIQEKESGKNSREHKKTIKETQDLIDELKKNGMQNLQKYEANLDRSKDKRINNAFLLIQRINHLIEKCQNEDNKRKLIALRSEIASGLCSTLIHMRTGEVRFGNAISIQKDANNQLIFKEGRHPVTQESSYSTEENLKKMKDLILKLDEFKKLTKKEFLTSEEEEKINQICQIYNFDELKINVNLIENTDVTVIKFFATIAEILKYIDNQTPIRFLISEFSHEFSYHTALFFAKFFEVEDKVEIAPLIESKEVVQKHGFEIIRNMLSDPSIVNYIKLHGKFFVQFGFSDGGRQTGQFGFSDAVEILSYQIRALLDSKGLKDIDLVLFPTGGESDGRARNLISYRNTLQHYSGDLSRTTLDNRLDYNKTTEQTFQGLDGQFWFLQPELAENVLVQNLEFATSKPNVNDPYYQMENADLINDLHQTPPEFCSKILKQKGHALMLDMMQFTDSEMRFGSRPIHRKRDSHSQENDIPDAEKKRAISYTSILQNLNYKMQVLAGIGTTLKDFGQEKREHLYRLIKDSPRLQGEMHNILRAFHMVDPCITREYIRALDPETYFQHAQKRAINSRLSDELNHTGKKIEAYSAKKHGHENQTIIELMKASFNDVFQDYSNGYHFLKKLLEEYPEVKITQEHKDHLSLLHCLRIAIMREIKRLSIKLPRFQSKGGYHYSSTMQMFNSGEIKEAISIFKYAFPKSNLNENQGISIMKGGSSSYNHYHENIFDPILKLNELFIKITPAISMCEDGWG